MRMNKDIPTILTIIVMAMLLIGSFITYTFNPFEYDADAELENGVISVDLSASAATEYAVNIFSISEDSNIDRKVVLYYDEGYASISGHEWQSEFNHNVTRELGVRNYAGEISTVNAEELKAIFMNPATANEYVVVVGSGVLPDNIYAYDGSEITNGGPGDEVDIIKWMESGGLMAWTGVHFGYYSAPADVNFKDWTTDSSQPLEKGPEMFSIELNTKKANSGDRSEIADALGLTQNVTTYGVKVQGDNVKNLGYLDKEGYSSVARVTYGSADGGLLISGGYWMSYVSLSQVISSGAYAWESYSTKSGEFKDTLNLKIAEPSDWDGKMYVYIHFGSVYPVLGKLIEV